MHKLVNLRMGKELEKYLEEFEGVVGDMERRGHVVVEVERAMFLLCGIPEDWGFLRSQVFLKYEYKDLTAEKVKTALREYNSSLKLREVADGESEGGGVIEHCMEEGKGKERKRGRSVRSAKGGDIVQKSAAQSVMRVGSLAMWHTGAQRRTRNPRRSQPGMSLLLPTWEILFLCE
eukprot:Phypoly_transcript_07537.p1 GENE.Phypoly_transcript_07537~~Phypoly_transcript_07537.p1  ORF type:complete len:176 (+),score=26.35 Phypoly_transcript_07537:523-1050(+)